MTAWGKCGVSTKDNDKKNEPPTGKLHSEFLEMPVFNIRNITAEPISLFPPKGERTISGQELDYGVDVTRFINEDVVFSIFLGTSEPTYQKLEVTNPKRPWIWVSRSYVKEYNDWRHFQFIDQNGLQFEGLRVSTSTLLSRLATEYESADRQLIASHNTHIQELVRNSRLEPTVHEMMRLDEDEMQYVGHIYLPESYYQIIEELQRRDVRGVY